MVETGCVPSCDQVSTRCSGRGMLAELALGASRIPGEMMIPDWKEMRSVLLTIAALPSWTREIVSEGSEFLPEEVTLEEEAFDASYIEFLEEQIRLGPRGPEWNRILEARKTALERYVDQVLVNVRVQRGHECFVARLAPPALAVVHTEEL
jgi:hypothetical protein